MADAFNHQTIALPVPARGDPAIKFLFSVVSQGFGSLGSFSKVSGISEEIEVVEARDGQDPFQTRKLVGTHQGGKAVFERGVVENINALVDWFKIVKLYTPFAYPSPSRLKVVRADVLIGIVGCDNLLVRVVRLNNAWPSAYELGDLDAKSSDIEIESLSVVFESLGIVNSSQIEDSKRDWNAFVSQEKKDHRI